MPRSEGLGLDPPHDIYPPVSGTNEPSPEGDNPLHSVVHMTDSPVAQPPSMNMVMSRGDMLNTPQGAYYGHDGMVTSPSSPIITAGNGTPKELYGGYQRRSRVVLPMTTLDPEGVTELSRRLSTGPRRRSAWSNSFYDQSQSFGMDPSFSSKSHLAMGAASPMCSSPYPDARTSPSGIDATTTEHGTFDPFDENNKFDLSYLLHEIYAEMDQRGNERRSMGIAFRDLRVTGYGTGAQLNETFGSLLLAPLRIVSGVRNMMHRPIKTILQDVEGCVKPGEMLLVLGRPGSGCTSLLKALASYRDGFRSVDGTVLYEGLDHRSIDGPLRGDVVYSPEDDVHFPTLTVGQTLRLSLIHI